MVLYIVISPNLLRRDIVIRGYPSSSFIHKSFKLAVGKVFVYNLHVDS